MCARAILEDLGRDRALWEEVGNRISKTVEHSKVFKKRKGAQISGIGGGMKGGTGPKTGVELRYYKPKEYKTLSMEEKDEVRELRPESKASKGDNNKTKVNSYGKNRGKNQIEKKSLGKIISEAKLLPSRSSTKRIWRK